MSQNEHPYQKVIDFINENGLKATRSASSYKLLHCLAKIHKIDMNGGRSTIMREFNYSKNKTSKLAKDALDHFCSTGEVIIPQEFLFRRKKLYRHDGNPTANRNLWRVSNKAKKDNHRNEPVTYTYNTAKK